MTRIKMQPVEHPFLHALNCRRHGKATDIILCVISGGFKGQISRRISFNILPPIIAVAYIHPLLIELIGRSGVIQDVEDTEVHVRSERLHPLASYAANGGMDLRLVVKVPAAQSLSNIGYALSIVVDINVYLMHMKWTPHNIILNGTVDLKANEADTTGP